MANFSVELRTVVEAGVNIFGFPYEFYDESKRAEFEKNFIRHFYFREIGCETTERFRWYLEDKMRTVFPYYNELFKAAQIEYNILDNYNVTEEYEIRRKGLDKENNVSSSVGSTSDNQTSETNETRKGEGSVISTGGANESLTENVAEDGKEIESANSSKESTATQVTDSHKVQKYLDTPQGALDISQSKYLTNLTDNQENTSSTTTGSEDVNSQGTKTVDKDTVRTVQGESTNQQSSATTDDSSTNSTAVFNGEHRLTHDNNTRTEKVGDHVETSKYTKKGNIGIDTDSDMITKHINLQKVLRNIERMFFEECEDLFMLVYE